jgi:DHA1 family multidrug resistance protein-like MFS transporter
MAIWTGASVGPLLGGLVADTWGYRAAFWVTGSLLFLAGLTVWRFVKEDFQPPAHQKDGSSDGFWDGLKLVVHHRGLVSIFGIRFMTRAAVRLMGPVLPLFIQSLVPPAARVATITGLISGVGAAASAIGAVTLGRASDRLGYRRVLLACAIATSILYIPQFFVINPWQLLVLQGAVGLVMSGVLASMSALLANLAPEGRQGAVYGLDSSVVAMANAVGPMLGATVAATVGLRASFLFTAGILALAAGLTWLLVPGSRQAKSPTS